MNKILIIEDEIIIAESLRIFLKKNSYEVSISSNVDKAVESLQHESYSGVICDINLQDRMNGIEIIQKFHQLDQHGPVIFLTAYSNPQVMEYAEEVTPYAYILKPFNNQQLLTTLNLALKNRENYIQPTQDTSVTEKLSKREVEILQSLATGKTNKVIGKELCISKLTVDTHVKNIKEKLQLNKKGELIRFVLSNRL
ncbi:response regulator transcription factor [Salinimicrobium sp. MT39]|uniref:Response regulator transcription factor n=1 Tax=Salinimicrobium profundisediminis TaxID=2994553 RepID=A0A9X3CZH2_9FLAO|nr:response regulator transcription factor [Salinimicrobium profundisediminis]MCX2839576.1 response regulator transcription factor [Salinimicrobium profundisediminis]